MSEVFETSCHVWDLDYQTPEDDSSPFATFIIDVRATFTSAASYSGDDDEDEDGGRPFIMESETENVVIEKTVEVGVQNLMNNNSSLRVRDMLASMDIPVRDFMVERILACAHRMGMTERYRNRKVLRMRVEIEAVVDELPHDQYHDHDADEDEDDGEHSDNKSETAEVIEKPRKVVIESANNYCPICLEDFLVGTEATGLPDCSHVFHPHCVIPWLYKKKMCPLCRSELN